MLGIRHRGTLGVLLDAKRAGLVAAVQPILDRLQSLDFRLDARTRRDVLELAGEAS
jgi:predicted nucleic acid-binding protein